MKNADRASVETIRRLNRGYIAAYMEADVGWYRRHLARDFVCIESDGSVQTRAKFLAAASQEPDVAAYRLASVRVRFYGGGAVALVQATGRFTRPDGRRGTSRYTDVYVRKNGSWKVVSAQITRTAGDQAT
ncbi:MAG TPA: nuclear transport factor 2 family protein [Thermoanaerobaculia bacterium]|nr:nuclear transport factor 2 family protein [Thermoanaerobaculia bacterium]